MYWVVPTAVAQIRFVEWTDDEHLRHAAFVGLRTDKLARMMCVGNSAADGAPRRSRAPLARD